MYNILLTDDEQIVIDSLTFILNKNFSGKIKLFSALSGSDALKIVQSEKIDIAFMDIHMPGINGLETISLIKQINPNTIIIILSAYDQFHYAQEAINLGAYKYLTKPVNRNLIIQTVQSSMDEVDSKYGKLSDNIELHEKLNLVTSMVESDFIYSLIFNNSSQTDFSDYLDYFAIKDASYFMCCLEVPNLKQKNRYETYVKIRDILTSKGRCIIGSFMVNRLGIFFPIIKSTLSENMEKDKADLMKNIFLLLSTKLYSGLRLGVSAVQSDITKSSNAYNDAQQALNSTPLSGGISFFESSTHSSKTEAEVQRYSLLILNRIRIGDAASVRQNISNYITSLSETYMPQMDKLKGFVFEFLINVRNIVLEVNNSYRNEAFDSAFSVLSQTDDLAIIEEFLLNRCIECAAAMTEYTSNNENPIIKKACEYIEENLSKEISLEQLASHLSVSPFYLSKLFKEERGENYISYLTSCRLEKAKNLLQNETLIIKEITSQIGYNDQNYFSKLFKMKFGITPTEYRESIHRLGNTGDVGNDK